MLRREVEEEILPYCRDRNIGVINYSPMLSGMLTGKVDADWVESLPDDDWRKKFNEEFREPHLSINIDFVENTLRPIAKRYDVSPGQVAVAWTLRDPVVTSAIVGARNPSQVHRNVLAANIQLTNDELAQIEQGLSERAAQIEALGEA